MLFQQVTPRPRGTCLLRVRQRLRDRRGDITLLLNVVGEAMLSRPTAICGETANTLLIVKT